MPKRKRLHRPRPPRPRSRSRARRRVDALSLSEFDKVYYVGVLLPKITRRATEYLETLGPALVVLG